MWILDSSAALECKRFDLVPRDSQWDFWEALLDLVQARELVFPKEVRRELSDVRHPDMPGGWAPRAWREMQPKPAPRDGTVAQVVTTFPDLVDPDSDLNAADPYVVALALEKRADGYSVRVVANDAAIHAACTGFGIEVVVASSFAEHILA